MKKIGVVSDTHGLLRTEVLEILMECDAIVHAGDIDNLNVLTDLRSLAPVYVVRGNNDRGWATQIPFSLDFQLYGLRCYMTHKRYELPKDLNEYDIVFYGHSHKYESYEENGTLFLNPGSCGPKRFNQDITMAILTIDEAQGECMIRRVDL